MCIRPCWQMSGSISCCSILTMIWPIPRGARDVRVAVCSTPPGIGASPGACRPGWTRRPIAGGSASAACRHRATPPSLRFLGGRVYLATMVVLISVMRHGATVPRVARLSQLVGVPRRTVARWREWWRTAFAESRFWQAKRAVFMPPVDRQRLPASLLERFAAGGGEQLLALLRFLAPISGGAIGHAW